MKTILIQGAMDCEIDEFIDFFKPKTEKVFGGFKFWISEFFGARIIISKTDIGIINATIATTIAIFEFKPDIVINQGCAGSAKENLKVGDIVIGDASVYINNFKTPLKSKNDGSNSLDWIASTKRSYKIESSKNLVEIAKQLDSAKNFKFGILGSGDFFNREYDRICHLQNLFNHLCEDMESVGVFKACEDFGVERIGFRVISNNELNKTDLDKSTTKISQQLTINFIKKYLEIKD